MIYITNFILFTAQLLMREERHCGFCNLLAGQQQAVLPAREALTEPLGVTLWAQVDLRAP